jgi:putative ABC transport system ATP-binding protein
MAAAVVLEHLSKRYPGVREAALSDVSLTIEPGEFVSVTGPSGAGKSTLLAIIAALDVPTAGRVIVAGQDLATLSDDARSDLRLRSIGLVFPGLALLPTFTVEENVRWPLEILGCDAGEGHRRARAALALIGLADALHGRLPAQLSSGQQQRVAIARALVAGPQLLLANEPTGTLDVHAGQEVLDLLRRLNLELGLTVVLTTRSSFAATYGHRTVELSNGRIAREVRAPGIAASARRP